MKKVSIERSANYNLLVQLLIAFLMPLANRFASFLVPVCKMMFYEGQFLKI